MKKTIVFCAFIITCFPTDVFSQASSELNFGLIGANYEIPVHQDVTIAPGAGYSIYNGNGNVDSDFDLGFH